LEVIILEYSIKQISEITGYSQSTLRYYEKEKLLPPVKRNINGVRIYSEDYLEWISLISCLKNTNMPVSEIKKFVVFCAEGDKTLKERLDIVLKHQQDIKDQIAELKNYQKHIDFKVEYYKKAIEAGNEDAVKYLYRGENKKEG